MRPLYLVLTVDKGPVNEPAATKSDGKDLLACVQVLLVKAMMYQPALLIRRGHCQAPLARPIVI